MSENATLEKLEQTINKSAIKDFAVSARRKLKERVELKANLMGFYADNREVHYEFEDDKQYKINGETFDKKQADVIREKIKNDGFESVIDEVAYTWFNRFIALYFMELHGYIENGLNVISAVDDLNKTALAAPNYFKNINKEKLFNAVQENKSEDIYKELIIAQCNELSKNLSFLFEKISDYSELLFPDGLLNKDSVIREMMALDKSNWDEVEIIGWLYQYYISEKKEEIVGLNKGIISTENIPAATQLFTPKWIVKYMVQNSLGKFYADMYPDNIIEKSWEYYLKSKENKLTSKNIISPEEITFLDPCCGSGHILVYAFELFYEIYKAQGYLEEEIPNLILEKNIKGLDICKRAVQLANFAVIMKARSYSKNVNWEKLTVLELKNSVHISKSALDLICKTNEEKEEIKNLILEFANTKCYGSLIIPQEINFDKYIDLIKNSNSNSLFGEELKNCLLPILLQAKMLFQKYTIVATNPPFLNKYNSKLKEFMWENYKKYKEDLYSAFIYKCSNWSQKNGYTAMMSPMTWMFISSHQDLREFILNSKVLSSLIRPEYHAFYSSAHVPICTFVINNELSDNKGVFIDLNDFRGEDLQPILVREAVKNIDVKYRYEINSKKFKLIPGSPIAYWASDRVREIFAINRSLSAVCKPTQGLATADNERFIRFWSEVDFLRIGFNFKSREDAKESKLKWFPYNKGGNFRKWYGNNEYVVNWENDGSEIINFVDKNDKQLSRPQNTQFYFRESGTWSFISSTCFGVRYSYPGAIFDVGGSSVFAKENLKIIIGFLCSKLTFEFLKLLNPTLNFQVGNVGSLPIIFPDDENLKNKIDNVVNENIKISKDDWDSFETSWDFEQHPLLRFRTPALQMDCRVAAAPLNDSYKIQDSFNAWKQYKEEQFNKLKANEEELNRLFIEIYDLQDEMTPEVDDKDITVSRADELREVKSLLSYAVGCTFGRYSLDDKGLVFAGGTFDCSKYKSLEADEDGILPVLSDIWFEDDIVDELKRFLKAAFGELYLNENMQYIAHVLNGKSTEKPETVIRNYFLKDFYKDHLQVYKRRPIYWMFTSGKEKAFNCLIYLHRYDKTTLSRIRKDYLHEFQAKLDRAIVQAEDEGNIKLTSLYNKYKVELLQFDGKIKDLADAQIELDLDDGVKVNYGKFRGLLEAEKDVAGKEK